MKIYPQVLTFLITPQIWLFHVVVLLTTAKKWTKLKNARAERAKLLSLSTKYANLRRSRCRHRCRFLSSLLLKDYAGFGRLTYKNTVYFLARFVQNESFQSITSLTSIWTSCAVCDLKTFNPLVGTARSLPFILPGSLKKRLWLR